MSDLKTSLYEEHLKLNAKMLPFAGYSMPIQYNSVKEEVIAVRENVGIFDVSHMGEFFIQGPDTVKFIDYLITNDYQNAEVGKAVYSPICRKDGTVIDDLIAYKLKKEESLICVNAANIKKDFEWIKSHISDFNCEIIDKSNDYSLIAVQGPNSEEVLRDIGFQITDEHVYYSAGYLEWNNQTVIIARTGYTGEDGFEIFATHKIIKDLWAKLINSKVTPCGLAARDVLRLEVCYPLYGNEIHDDVTPFDGSLNWTVKLNKDSFIGKEALTDYQSKYRLIKLFLDKGIPRTGHEIFLDSGEKVGVVTSGTMSVSMGKGIALCHIDRNIYSKDKKFNINIRGKLYPATVATKAFYSGGHK